MNVTEANPYEHRNTPLCSWPTTKLLLSAHIYRNNQKCETQSTNALQWKLSKSNYKPEI